MIITRAQVKEELGLNAIETYDAQIDELLPVIDSKVKQITRVNWDMQILGDTTNGSNLVEVYSVINYAGRNMFHRSGINASFRFDDIHEYLFAGAQLTGDNLASGTYISEVYYNEAGSVTLSGTEYTVPVIQMSANATVTETGADIFVGMPTAYLNIVAKGVWYLIQNKNTKLPVAGITDKSIGTVSVSFGDDVIDGRFGMPSWFVKGLPRHMGGH